MGFEIRFIAAPEAFPKTLEVGFLKMSILLKNIKSIASNWAWPSGVDSGTPSKKTLIPLIPNEERSPTPLIDKRVSCAKFWSLNAVTPGTDSIAEFKFKLFDFFF